MEVIIRNDSTIKQRGQIVKKKLTHLDPLYNMIKISLSFLILTVYYSFIVIKLRSCMAWKNFILELIHILI